MALHGGVKNMAMCAALAHIQHRIETVFPMAICGRLHRESFLENGKQYRQNQRMIMAGNANISSIARGIMKIIIMLCCGHWR